MPTCRGRGDAGGARGDRARAGSRRRWSRSLSMTTVMGRFVTLVGGGAAPGAAGARAGPDGGGERLRRGPLGAHGSRGLPGGALGRAPFLRGGRGRRPAHPLLRAGRGDPRTVWGVYRPHPVRVPRAPHRAPWPSPRPGPLRSAVSWTLWADPREEPTRWKSRSASASPGDGPTGSTTSRSSRARRTDTPRMSTSRGSSTRSAFDRRPSSAPRWTACSRPRSPPDGQPRRARLPQPRGHLDALRGSRRAARGDRRATARQGDASDAGHLRGADPRGAHR